MPDHTSGFGRYQNAITKKFEIERTTQKEMTYLSHIIRISRLLEKLGEEKSKSAAGTGTGSGSAAEALPHLRAFVDGVCDTVNALLIRFACETKSEPIDAEVSEWEILTREGVDAAQDVSAAIFSQLLDNVNAVQKHLSMATSLLMFMRT